MWTVRFPRWGDIMGEDIITPYQKTVLQVLSKQDNGCTRNQIKAYNAEQKLGLPAGELDTILESLIFRNFIRAGTDVESRWHITERGLCAVGEKSGDL
jgi:hypothetical protein